jgi:hypothetical protein
VVLSLSLACLSTIFLRRDLSFISKAPTMSKLVLAVVLLTAVTASFLGGIQADKIWRDNTSISPSTSSAQEKVITLIPNSTIQVPYQSENISAIGHSDVVIFASSGRTAPSCGNTVLQSPSWNSANGGPVVWLTWYVNTGLPAVNAEPINGSVGNYAVGQFAVDGSFFVVSISPGFCGSLPNVILTIYLE